ncbi:MAG: UDP-3-O-[3-hydroxymyristoyl] N-acetylglucosamine deacetylase [Candidatus Meridianibacter frigidus]|nr:MAG: UDP-3-O-[3-hydroxymyristoyl] N-acetylglucosamine deacetylase [Candidatus Eremiobacteraeota bacterium]
MSANYQSTLAAPASFEGLGIHTGLQSRADVLPADPGSGIRFVLADGAVVPATAEYVVETARATVLGKDGSTVSTVEHLLAALFGMGIDNAAIHVSGPEVPVVDGSARAFANAFAEIGTVRQHAARARYVPVSPKFFRDGGRTVIVLPASSFRVKFLAEFAPPIGTQYLDAEVTPEFFAREIAGARTFGYLAEVEALLKRGLAQGGTMENAIVFAPDGPLQPLRWPDEVVRHKVLDLIGDFALLGAYPQCEVIAIKSGHRLHCLATVELRKDFAGSLPSANAR